MSAAADEPEPEVVKLVVASYPLKAQTDDEVATAQIRFCDGRGEEQLFGCVRAVKIGFKYSELCAECVDALRKALA